MLNAFLKWFISVNDVINPNPLMTADEDVEEEEEGEAKIWREMGLETDPQDDQPIGFQPEDPLKDPPVTKESISEIISNEDVYMSLDEQVKQLFWCIGS